MTETRIVTTDDSAFDIAKRRARYGNRDWLVWHTGGGACEARPYCADAIKAALLAVGTRGRLYWYSGSTGIGNICRSWSYGIHLWRCARGFERIYGKDG